VQDPPPGSAARVWREAVARARGEKEPEPWEPEVWIEEPDPPRAAKPAKTKPQPARTKAAGQPRNLRKPKRGADRLPDDVRSEIAGAPGAKRSPRIQERLGEAARAYERDRYRDALQLLRPLADQAPEAGAVRELLGLTLYRLGRWTAAIKELETFHTLTGSYDQHPPLADCYRALKRWRKVNEVWEELRTASPSAELVAEGRLVVAGSLADRGEVGEAIKLLESAPGIDRSARVQDHHLRLWYALGDLYERAGEVPRARDLFRRVADRDPDVYDVGERLANLS
jgi:tetratricopeptide (TPR) repeat protein